MNQIEKALLFKSLHTKGNPLILYNIWDAGSAKAVEEAGAKALATGSWSVAAAWGYTDGENVPLNILEQVTRRIVDCADLPLTVDFESGYDPSVEIIAKNASLIIEAGAIGVNFEDQIVGSDDLYSVKDQCNRISAIRKIADKMDVPLFINARTDHFLKATDQSEHESLMSSVKERANAYAEAGANGYFVPGLMNNDLISDICNTSTLPVNIMMMDGVASVFKLSQLGVSRISHGPFPYIALMDILTARAKSEL